MATRTSCLYKVKLPKSSSLVPTSKQSQAVDSWLQENLHKVTHASSELARGSRVNDWRFWSYHISDV